MRAFHPTAPAARATRTVFAAALFVVALCACLLVGCQNRAAPSASGAPDAAVTPALDAGGCDPAQAKLVEGIEQGVNAIEEGLARVERATSPASRVDEINGLPDPGHELFDLLKSYKESTESAPACERLTTRMLALRSRFRRAMEWRASLLADAGAGPDR